jgi:hypothetical protein
VKELAVAALAAASLAAASPPPWRPFVDPAAGFSISVPAAWRVVPRSTSQLDALVAQLRKRKQIVLADQFAEIAATRKVTHTLYRFQAFVWPPPKGSVVPDVSVKTDRLAVGTTRAALPLIAREIAKALSRSPSPPSPPVHRKLPAGPAVEVTGSARLTKSLRSRYAVYLLIHNRKLYSITFRGPATAVEARIVNGFRFM